MRTFNHRWKNHSVQTTLHQEDCANFRFTCETFLGQNKTSVLYLLSVLCVCYLKLACVCCTTSLELAEVALKPVCLAREDMVCCVW